MIKPAGYRILIKPVEVEEKTAGGIILPEQVKDKEQYAQTFGHVVAIGEFCWHDYKGPWCKVGDKVSFNRYCGVMVTDPDTKEEYRMLNDCDILTVIVP